MVTAVADPRFPGGQSLKQWADALVARLDQMLGWGPLPASVVAADEQGLEAWANRESGGYNPKVAGGRNNPLNTTEGALGFAGQGGSQGNIKDFGTFGQGVDAQAYNLVHTQGAGYQPIVAALRSGDVSALFRAVDASGFGTHGLSSKDLGNAGPSSSGSGSTPATLTGFSFPNPLSWVGDIFGGVKADVAKVGITLAVLGMGLALIVLGAWRSVSPNVRQNITSSTKTAATAAAMA
jgi:hypothetical protein